jgi:hypothetical protein
LATIIFNAFEIQINFVELLLLFFCIMKLIEKVEFMDLWFNISHLLIILVEKNFDKNSKESWVSLLCHNHSIFGFILLQDVEKLIRYFRIQSEISWYRNPGSEYHSYSSGVIITNLLCIDISKLTIIFSCHYYKVSAEQWIFASHAVNLLLFFSQTKSYFDRYIILVDQVLPRSCFLFWRSLKGYLLYLCCGCRVIF